MIDRALTLTQPWAGLVALGVKRIENRQMADCLEPDFENQQRFWMGPHAHVLRGNRHYAQPIPCGGARSFWHLSPELRSKVVDAEHMFVGGA